MREDGLMPDDPPYRDFLQSGAPRSSAVKTPREVHDARFPLSEDAVQSAVLVPLDEILKTIETMSRGGKFIRVSDLLKALR